MKCTLVKLLLICSALKILDGRLSRTTSPHYPLIFSCDDDDGATELARCLCVTLIFPLHRPFDKCAFSHRIYVWAVSTRGQCNRKMFEYMYDWPRFKRSMCVWIRMNCKCTWFTREYCTLSAGLPRRTMSCLFRITLFIAAAADDSPPHRPQCWPFNCCIHSIAHFLRSSFVFPFTCYTGQYRIQDLDKVMYALNKQFGKIAKVGGLIGHPDLLFVFDGDEIRKIFKKEETLPHRCPTNEPFIHSIESHLIRFEINQFHFSFLFLSN